MAQAHNMPSLGYLSSQGVRVSSVVGEVHITTTSKLYVGLYSMHEAQIVHGRGGPLSVLHTYIVLYMRSMYVP